MSILSNRFNSAQIEKLAMAVIVYRGFVHFSRETFSDLPGCLTGPIDEVFDYEIRCEVDEYCNYNFKIAIFGPPLCVEFFTIEEVLFAADITTIGEKLVELSLRK